MPNTAHFQAVGDLIDSVIHSHLHHSVEVGVVGSIRSKPELHFIINSIDRKIEGIGEEFNLEWLNEWLDCFDDEWDNKSIMSEDKGDEVNQIKLIAVGDSGVGKTSILTRFTY